MSIKYLWVKRKKKAVLLKASSTQNISRIKIKLLYNNKSQDRVEIQLAFLIILSSSMKEARENLVRHRDNTS